MPTLFQPAFGGNLNGIINSVAVISPGAAPSDIVESGLSFFIRVTFRVTGPMVHMVNGTYRIGVALEGYGSSAAEVDLPAQTVAASNFSSMGMEFREYIVNVMAPSNLPNGVYDVAVLVTHVTDLGQPGPIAGFCDDQTLQIFPNSPLTTP